MGYQLSVDLGTTYTAAAVSRDGRVEVASLGTSGPVIPSVVLLRADGEVLVGEAAVRRGLDEPNRVAREFKRRLGDPTPLVLGGTPYGAEALMAHLLRWVVKTVSDREGAPPDRVVLTHPANFGPYKLDMMREVARVAGLDLGTTLFLTEPQGAAISYALRNRIEPGAVIAVYDFGGGTFDAALLQRSDDGFRLLGRPEGMERFGGIDIDSAILAHVDQEMNGAIRVLDPDDPEVNAAVARLKDECRTAKETLASDTDTSIDVQLPGGVHTRIRLTRRELEEMVRPRLEETVETLQRAVRSAGLAMEQVSRILLVGGSSRMPLVGETLQRLTGRPVAVDAHPKFAIALGAAAFTGDATTVTPVLATSPIAPHAPTPGPTPGPTPVPTPAPMPPAPMPPAPNHSQPPPPPPAAPTAATAPPAQQAPTPSSPGSPARFEAAPTPTATLDPKRRKMLIGAGLAAALLVGGGVFLATRGSDEVSAPTIPTAITVPPPALTTIAPAPTVAPAPPTEPTTIAPETTVAPVVPVVTEAPTTIVAAPLPLTQEQAQSATVTPAELSPDWIVGTFTPSSGDTICGAPIFNPVLVQAGTAYNRSVGGQAQALVNIVGTFADSAAAQNFYATLLDQLKNCPSFDTTTPTGLRVRLLIQTRDTASTTSGCQTILAERVDVIDFNTAAGLSSSFNTLQICGNNSVFVGFSTAYGDAPLSVPLQTEVNAAFLASTAKLLNLPVVP